MATEKLTTPGRLQSLDYVRGLVMVLMAIDHVRVYSGLPAGGPDPGIFFTRWITHFCAPAFVFFAGTSAFLYGSRLADAGKLARYLITRGLLLVVLELTVIKLSWTFGLDYATFTLAGVIWMIGWCMVLLSLFVKLSAQWAGIIGVAIIVFQQVFGLVPLAIPEAARNGFSWLWEFIYPSGLPGFPGVTVLYSIVPWIGVMLAGYGFGAILRWDELQRKQWLIRLGAGLTLVYLLIGSVTIIMNPNPEAPPFLFRLLGQQKYPASALFLMMTLGPSILLMAFVEKVAGPLTKAMVTFGRVPFFYYLIHIPVIHLSALVVQAVTLGSLHHEWYATAPYTTVPHENQWSLGLLYLVFFIDVVILYLACRWYEGYKFSHPESGWVKWV